MLMPAGKRLARCRDNPVAATGIVSIRVLFARRRRGLASSSVIASWLLDLTATELLKEPSLKSYAGRVSDSGEGRWDDQGRY